MWKLLLSCVNNCPGPLSGVPGLCLAGLEPREAQEGFFWDQLIFEEGVSMLFSLPGVCSASLGQLWWQSSVQAVAWLFPAFMGFSSTENAPQVPALSSLLCRGVFPWVRDEEFGSGLCPLKGIVH